MSYMGGFVTPVVAFVLPALCYRRMQPLPIDFRLLPLCGRCLPNCVRASAVLALAALAIEHARRDPGSASSGCGCALAYSAPDGRRGERPGRRSRVLMGDDRSAI